MYIDQVEFAKATLMDVYTPSGIAGTVRDIRSGGRVWLDLSNGQRRWYRRLDLTASEALRALPDYPEERATYRIGYADKSNNMIDDSMYAADDAWSANVFGGAHGDSLVAWMERRQRRDGMWWYIHSSDGPMELSWYDKRFRTVEDAIGFLGDRWGTSFTEAVCRCGTGGECDD